MPSWDIFGCGIVAVDDFLTVENYPPPDAKTPVLSKTRQGGGLTGTTLVAASRLGAKCGYGGVLGGDPLSAWTIEELEREGVDCAPIIRQTGAQPFHSVIIVDRTAKTRNIFYSDVEVMPRPLESIDESLIGQTRLLFIDHLGVESMLHAAGIAKRMGIPTIADIELGEHPQTDALMAHIDYLILSASFAAAFTGKNDPARSVEHLAAQSPRTCTIVTAGDRGLLVRLRRNARGHPACSGVCGSGRRYNRLRRCFSRCVRCRHNAGIVNFAVHSVCVRCRGN